MRVELERIAVKGAPAQEVALKFTRHGPVVHIDRAANRAFALRSVWFEPGTSPYLGSLAYLDARRPEDFAKAMAHWGTPPVNHVYADSSGNIAWMTAGLAPRRPNWDGLLPVPGDGTYEWDGFHAPEDLPREINPARGFVATANEMNLPAGYSYAERKLSFEWSERSRATRIMEALSENRSYSLADSMALQCDVVSIPARRLLPLLAGLGRSDEELALASDLLRAWDCRLGPESAAAALFELWWSRHLKPSLLAQLAGDPTLAKLLAPGDNETLLAILEQPETEPLLATRSARDAILARTLKDAVAECRSRLGPDPDGWAWGRLHHGYFEHALSGIAPEKKAAMDIGPLPIGGSGSTPMNTTYRLPDFRVTSGATFRMVLDVGAWDNSRAINAPGQSGLPESPHYRDLSQHWAKSEYVPLLFTRDAVAKAARLRILLEPAAMKGH
jgi:penicillin amidase